MDLEAPARKPESSGDFLIQEANIPVSAKLLPSNLPEFGRIRSVSGHESVQRL
jgi:hypothetical protein